MGIQSLGLALSLAIVLACVLEKWPYKWKTNQPRELFQTIRFFRNLIFAEEPPADMDARDTA